MSLSNDLPVLVCPRPIRLPPTSPFFSRPARTPSRLDNDPHNDLSSQSPSPLSGRSSTLPSEALEEFLSILKPSFFPSSSPTLGKARRSLTIPAFQYERPLALRPRQRLENSLNLKPDAEDTSESHPSAPTSPVTVGGEQQDSSFAQYEQDGPVNRWLRFGPLASPVSRMHTRNPFIKQLAEQGHSTARAISPAAIPLPTPTPDEWRILQDV